MPFDKRAFNKAVKEHMTAHGYTPHKNRKDYFIDAPDGRTRLVVRVPDGVHGFFFGAQFSDKGSFSGSFSETAVRWYVCETVLGGASVQDDSPEDIAQGLRQATDTLAPYIAGGKAEIAAHLNDFFGDDLTLWTAVGKEIDEGETDSWLTYFGFPPVDPYGDRYFAYTPEGLVDRDEVGGLLGEEGDYLVGHGVSPLFSFMIPQNRDLVKREWRFDGKIRLSVGIFPGER